jgi:hypothetical protein
VERSWIAGYPFRLIRSSRGMPNCRPTGVIPGRVEDANPE